MTDGCSYVYISISGNMLAFMVGSKQAFEVSLADVSQTQLQGKNDVILEFHVDDTTGANEVYLYIHIHPHIVL
jgi:structure-specific recognition protein 1